MMISFKFQFIELMKQIHIVGEGLDPPVDFDNSKITIAEGNKIIFPYENPEIVNYFRWEGQDPPLQYEFVSLAR